MKEWSYDNKSQSDKIFTLTIRATPAWIETFRSGLTEQLKAFGAKVTAQSITSEDSSAQEIDTDAQIKNKQALRNRLKGLVSHGKGKLKDIVDTANQVSDVQTDIDQNRAERAAMSHRVAMSKLTLTYASAEILGGQGTFAPLAHAVSSIVPNFVTVMSLLITILAVLSPIAIIVVPIIWFIRKSQTTKPKTQGTEPK